MALLERHSIANSGIVAGPLVQALLLRLPLSVQQRGWRAEESASRKRWCAPARCCYSKQPRHWCPSVAAVTAVRPKQVDLFQTKRIAKGWETLCDCLGLALPSRLLPFP